ncbi:thioredoxin domain-containing protein [Rhabdothermincola salaria]|uniref:thioredoxin domain-containing protein n=1 Tax=Rhabdothermincola salaria TaxID=2903142 RepID=UPI001E5AEB84|nr:thioredoxin domain-containing protein [Rhabdothermincola salaria]MCD9622507.1 thioredoxin domain-containing protein [Rhabdothermincola salaria]
MTGTNRLAQEASPYLRQHAHNPVDWYPWGDDAFAAARQRDVPVLISVGYSACHWCHVMAHESFEDDEVAAVVNEHFVAVKVDREERPDVDAVYMQATQAMTGSGGWPMTVFAFPDGRPFFAGTYFPKVARGGQMAFDDLCRRVAELWRDRRDDLVEQADALTEAIGSGDRLTPAEVAPSSAIVAKAVTGLLGQLDQDHGGFGRAPKFPQAMSIDLLLRHHVTTGDELALAAATTSLDAMASGGIYDHLGGGFARYATDQRWLVPHFEKMLYDQALLVPAYLHAWQVTGEARFLQVVEETVGYVLTDLRHPAGGFFAAEDADSEGVEGKFYVWTIDEIREVCGDDAQAAIDWYGVTDAGNWEGVTILERPVRGDLARPPAVERARRSLLAARSQRVRPGLDDKVLTEWNALMLAALAEAGAATGNAEWLAAAVANAEFLVAHLRGPDGRWLRSWQGPADDPEAGSARFLAYAGDHAALVEAFVRLAEATGQARWIDEADRIARALVELFWDDEAGGVFTTGVDAEALVTRPKDLMDNATPSANSLAAVGLARLAALTGDHTHRDRADAVVRLLGDVAGKHPTAFGHLLVAVDLLDRGTTEIVITGDRPDLLAEVHRRWLPQAVLAWGDPRETPLWEGRAETGSDGRAYVCQGYVCQAPASTIDELLARLD